MLHEVIIRIGRGAGIRLEILVTLVCTALYAVQASALPVNDECVDAISVTEGVPVSGSSVGATGAGSSPCSGADNIDVWYKYAPLADASVSITLCGSAYDTTLEILDGCGGPVVGCNDDNILCPLHQSMVNCLAVQAGHTYMIRIAGYYPNSAGDYTLEVQPECVFLPNDECSNATPLTRNVAVVSASTYATGTGVSSCGTLDDLDVWYSYTAVGDETVTVSLCPSAFDTTLAAYDSCGGAEVACNNNAACSATYSSLIDRLAIPAGETRLFRVAGNNHATGAYRIAVTMAPPVNDNCPGAIPVFDGDEVTGSTEFATDSGTTGCTGNDPQDVWYSFTPAADTFETLSLCGSGFDTTLSVWDGCGGTRLACNDDSLECGSSSVIKCMPMTGGQTYLIRIAGYSGHVGNYTLTLGACAPPVNDDCANALPLEDAVPVEGTTHAASGTGLTSCSPQDFMDVWYTYTPAVDEEVAFSLCGSTFDTTLAVYDGCGGTQLACNDDNPVCGGTGRISRIDSFNVTAGTNYLVRVAGVSSTRGDFKLSVASTVPPQVSSIVPASTRPVNADSLFFYVYFDRPVKGFDSLDDLVITQSGVSYTGVTISASDGAYDVEFQGLSGDGTIAIAVSAASDVRSVVDVPLAGSVTSPVVTVDHTAPTISGLLVTPGVARPGDGVLVSFDVNETLDGPPEVTVNGNPATPTAKAAFSYEYLVTPLDVQGPATVEVSVFDEAGNLGFFSSNALLNLSASPTVPLAVWPLGMALGLGGLSVLRRKRR